MFRNLLSFESACCYLGKVESNDSEDHIRMFPTPALTETETPMLLYGYLLN